MMGRTHKIGGIFVGVVASDIFLQRNVGVSAFSIGVLFMGSVIGSLLPDIDKKESLIGRKLWFISWPIYLLRIVVKLCSYVSPAMFLPLYRKVYKTMGHRYLAHSIFTWGVISFYMYLLQHQGTSRIIAYISRYFVLDGIMEELIKNSMLAFSIGISIGMLSHILLDMYTKDGVAIWMPLLDKKIRFPFSMKTNGVREKVFRKLLIVLILVVGYYVYTPYILNYIH